jgi:hypothetical protein
MAIENKSVSISVINIPWQCPALQITRNWTVLSNF